MERHETCNLRQIRGFDFRHQNRSSRIAGQLEVVLPPPLRRLGTLQLNRMNRSNIIVDESSNLYVTHLGAESWVW